MGGFSSFAALYLDELNALKAGYRMIHAGISVGSDFSFVSAVAPQEQLQAAFGSRTVGMIAGRYDEFFFNKSDEEKTEAEKAVAGTVTSKDFVSTSSGKSFLGLPAQAAAGQPGVFYSAASGDLSVENKVVRAAQTSERIVYTPNETHPWNHFSRTTTASLIEFYTHAFEGSLSSAQTAAALDSHDQIWPWKETFNAVALTGFFLLMVPLAAWFVRAPFLRRAVTASSIASVEAPSRRGPRLLSWAAVVFSALLPALLFTPLMGKIAAQLESLASAALFLLTASLIIALTGYVAARFNNEKPAASAKFRRIGTGGFLMAIAALALWLLLSKSSRVFPFQTYFNEPVVNTILYWAVVTSALAVFLMLGFHYFVYKQERMTFRHYGLGGGLTSIIASLCTAVAVLAAGYALLFLVQAVFGTDFRLWIVAVRTFGMEQLITGLKYMPFFLVFYLINAIAIQANSSGSKGGYAKALALNIGGLVGWVIVQYGKLFATGVAFYPDQHLNGIVLISLVPCLAIAALYARKLFLLTNNVWLAAFLNTMLFTMITTANTALFWNLI